MTPIPSEFDYLIIEQFDPLVSLPGGVETVIRGILKYAPADKRIGVVGVDSRTSPNRAMLGQWKEVQIGGNTIWFLPVCRISRGTSKRLIPHSLRLAIGTIRHRRSIRPSIEIHTHREGLAAFARLAWPSDYHRYFIHTQDGGSISQSSDSLWRKAARAQRLIQQLAVRKADRVHVFNPAYTDVLRNWNKTARFSPTWWDPDTTPQRKSEVEPYSVLWAGRLEVPKDPQLAVATFKWLRATYPNEPWTLTMVGSGSLMDELETMISSQGLANIVRLLGSREVAALGFIRSLHKTMLMTSSPGYEGFPMVLVEGLAAGLPAVVTDGSDTGCLIRTGLNGYVCPACPSMLGEALRDALKLLPEEAVASVAALSAPVVIDKLFNDD
ncbi:MAG: glycosyltransferase [Chloroflexia bacterium]|nr:glycosyltransferase [Chloroflexia bacterium]